jgi:hypothetical protein
MCHFESCIKESHAERHGCVFPRKCQGREFVLGIDSYPGLLVVKLGMCSRAW